MSATHFRQRDKFPQCCGATILSGFGRGQQGEPTLAQISRFLKAMPDIGEASCGDDWHEMERNAFHMAILNDTQKVMFHDTFVKCGFELVMSNHNGHSGSKNHLYVRKVDHSD